MEIVVFTNGCFDILHPGHVQLLKKARSLGTRLIVGINSDRSVRAIKGSNKPYLNEKARAEILRELRSVDEVLIFDENTPENLIRQIKPNVLVKGGDWLPEQIVGADFVLKNGGKVFSIPFETDISTTKIAEKILGDKTVRRAIESNNEDTVDKYLSDKIEIYKHLLDHESVNIKQGKKIIANSIQSGGRVLILESGSSDSILFPGIKTNLIMNQQIQSNVSEPGRIKKGDILIYAPQEEFGAENKIKDVEIDYQEKAISELMRGRAIGCKTLAVISLKEKKIAGVCDVVISLPESGAFARREAVDTIFELWFGN